MRHQNFALVYGKSLVEIHNLLDQGNFVVAYAAKCQVCGINVNEQKFEDAYLILPGIDNTEIAEDKLTKIKAFFIENDKDLMEPLLVLNKPGDKKVMRMTFKEVEDVESLKAQILSAWQSYAEGGCVLQEFVVHNCTTIEAIFLFEAEDPVEILQESLDSATEIAVGNYFID